MVANRPRLSSSGGKDLFGRLLPNTAPWAVLQAAREAGRRKDAELRSEHHDPDRIMSLFGLGFEIDERLDERLQDLKRSGHRPEESLPGLTKGIEVTWNRDRIPDRVKSHGEIATGATPIGRHIKGTPPANLGEIVHRLVGALAPLTDTYALPHFRKAK